MTQYEPGDSNDDASFPNKSKLLQIVHQLI